MKKKGELAFSQIVLEMHMHGEESVPTRDELAFSGILFADQQKLDESWPLSNSKLSKALQTQDSST